MSESPGEMKGNRALIMVQAWRLQRGQQADTWVGRWWDLKQHFNTWVGRWAIPDLGISEIDFRCSKFRKVETLPLTDSQTHFRLFVYNSDDLITKCLCLVRCVIAGRKTRSWNIQEATSCERAAAFAGVSYGRCRVVLSYPRTFLAHFHWKWPKSQGWVQSGRDVMQCGSSFCRSDRSDSYTYRMVRCQGALRFVHTVRHVSGIAVTATGAPLQCAVVRSPVLLFLQNYVFFFYIYVFSLLCMFCSV